MLAEIATSTGWCEMLNSENLSFSVGWIVSITFYEKIYKHLFQYGIVSEDIKFETIKLETKCFSRSINFVLDQFNTVEFILAFS